MATWKPPSTGCAPRAWPKPPRRPTASRPKGWSACRSRNGRGVAVEINSETDFVAKNADFQQLVREVTKVALETGDLDVEVLRATHLNGKPVSKC
jgi:translation elongation factor EF-Ts